MSENSILFEDLTALPQARVLCIGDVMLDRFVYGAVDRISPEAPIPVLRVTREKHMLGGVGNVVANIASLGAQSTLITMVGNDSAGAEVAALLNELGVTTALATSSRATTVKSRFVSGTQQMLRVDREVTEAVGQDIEDAVIEAARAHVPQAGAVVLSDYKKGLLTRRVVAEVIAIAKQHGVPVIVDPKDPDLSLYAGASVITPNRKELEAASKVSCASDDDVRGACMRLIADHGFTAILSTRSQDGMSLIAKDDAPVHIPAQVREIFDVSGAGDTVIAAFAAMLAKGAPLRRAALLANIAAGIVVGKPGTATARPDEIEKILSAGFDVGRQGHDGNLKTATAQQAADMAERLRVRGLKVGFTNGCFDLLHPGHVSSLRQARAACDYLIVAVNADVSVKRLKGESRPVQNEAARAAILSALEMVDMVVVFAEDTPYELIKAIRPDVLVKGGQYKLEEVVGYDILQAYGGKIVRADMEDGFSTTNTIAKMAG